MYRPDSKKKNDVLLFTWFYLFVKHEPLKLVSIYPIFQEFKVTFHPKSKIELFRHPSFETMGTGWL